MIPTRPVPAPLVRDVWTAAVMSGLAMTGIKAAVALSPVRACTLCYTGPLKAYCRLCSGTGAPVCPSVIAGRATGTIFYLHAHICECGPPRTLVTNQTIMTLALGIVFAPVARAAIPATLRLHAHGTAVIARGTTRRAVRRASACAPVFEPLDGVATPAFCNAEHLPLLNVLRVAHEVALGRLLLALRVVRHAVVAFTTIATFFLRGRDP